MTKELWKRAVINASLTVAYVAMVAVVMQNGEQIFGKMKTIFGPIAFLLLFVISAATTGSLVLGKPVLLYIDGAKKEAVSLFAATLACLAVVVSLIFLTLLLVSLV